MNDNKLPIIPEWKLKILEKRNTNIKILNPKKKTNVKSDWKLRIKEKKQAISDLNKKRTSNIPEWKLKILERKSKRNRSDKVLNRHKRSSKFVSESKKEEILELIPILRRKRTNVENLIEYYENIIKNKNIKE